QPAPPAASRPPFAALPGWAGDDHLEAFWAWRGACRVARDPDYAAACAAARSAQVADGDEARRYFETWFTPVAADGEGLLTSYFAPEYEARSEPDSEFSAAVMGPPPDLVRTEGPDGRPLYRRRGPDGALEPYAPRAEIEARGGRPLAWMRPEDLFFMQIQGSGYLSFPGGGRARAAYAADNGLPFTGIARPMAERGLLPRNGASGEAIRRWLAEHRGPEARAVTDLNPRYVFFALQPDDGGDPAGAAGVPLTAGRSIAVDPAHWRMGDLVFLSAEAGNLTGARRGYRGLAVALDTGGAIRGPVRADYYMGRGARAGDEAGTVRHPLRMWRLQPRVVRAGD
ncbi:MAG TPA: MltA domain-containing protein, partial [Caulobacteraceae bacterium]